MRLQPRLSGILLRVLCALFIFGALAYLFSLSDFSASDQRTSENSAIEEALQQMPTCTPFDRSRHRALLDQLQAWNQFAQEHHIRYWIAYGSLVGYVQRRGLLPYDQNIDVFVMAHDTAQLYQLSRLNFSETYELVVHPQWFVVDGSKRSYFKDEGINFVAPDGRFINKNTRRHIDIWPMYNYHPHQDRMEKYKKAVLTGYDEQYNWISSLKEWTFPLEQCVFSGVRVWCPAKPDKLVADIYGEISVNTPSKVCANGTWVHSDKYERRKKMNDNGYDDNEDYEDDN